MWFFKKKERLSVVLIDITSSSVAGAYAHYEEGASPAIYFTVRIPLDPRHDEDTRTAMLRTLEMVGTRLIETGAPTLRRETGSGRADAVLVSVSAPWQQTKVRTETVQPDKPFIFTKHMLSEIVSSSRDLPEGCISTGEMAIATILNGYEIPNPIGKRANRAEVVILSSTLESSIYENIQTRIRRWYHTHDIRFVAFASATYTVLRDLYPHQKDFLILNVSGEGTDLAYIRSGLLVNVDTIPHGSNTFLEATRPMDNFSASEKLLGSPTVKQEIFAHTEENQPIVARIETVRKKWTGNLIALIKSFAEVHALPRTLFLLADPNAREYLCQALNTKAFHELWLSDEPLAIISILPEQFTSYLRTRGSAEADIFLAILALYYAKTSSSRFK